MKSGKYILVIILSFEGLLHAQLYIPDNPFKHVFRDQVKADSTIMLPHPWFYPGSLHVTADSLTLVENRDFIVDTVRSALKFVHPDSSLRVTIRYRRLPVDLSGPFRRWEASDSPEPDSETPQVIRVQPGIQEEDQGAEMLEKSGSIFRGITAGTDGMRLESGLRLQVSGQIAPQVQVTASLTDQNTPIQPQGNTQTLQEIDKVVVQVNAPGLEATLGDFTYSRQNSAFGSYVKKWQGVMGRAESSFGNVTLLAAGSRGRFTTNHFTGSEGNQGPYQLTGEEGERDIIILAGTERVWIDGEPMKRGEDQDYTIEYGNGQITFTRNRLVTADSRITADFEYSDLKFQKEIYGASTEMRMLDNRLTLRASFLREGDNKEDPLDYPLTDEMRVILKSAGDSTELATTSGVQLTEGEGSYTRVDSVDVTYYLYAGAGNGDYTVRFSYLGSGRGDYTLEGFGNYRYAGKGKGSYMPVIKLPMAKRHQVATLESSLNLGLGIHLDAELGFSDLDKNLYASADDDDNTDIAYETGLRFNDTLRIAGTNFGKLDLHGSLRSVGNRFRPLGRMAEIEYGRKWGIDEGKFWGEKTGEIEATYRPFDFLSIEGDMGSYRGEGGFRSDRKQFAAELLHPKWPQFHYSGVEISSRGALEGYWLRQNADLRGRIGTLSPSVFYEGEHRKDAYPDSLQTGFRFDEWRAELGFQRNTLRAVFSEAIRDDSRYAGLSLSSYSRARTDKLQLEMQWTNLLSSALMFTHRNRNYTDPEIQDQRANLADVKLQILPGQHLLNGSINYRYSSTSISSVLRDTIHVERGYGNYRFDEELKELVPDADGDVILRLIQSDQFVPVNELVWGGDMALSGERMAGKKGGVWSIVEALKYRSILRIERRDRERGFYRVNRSALFPRWNMDSTVVLQRISVQHDIEFTPRKWLSWRVRLKKDDSENYQYLEEGILRRRSEQNIRMKANPLSSTGLLLEWQHSGESKLFTDRPWSDRNIEQYLYVFEVSFRPQQKIEFAIKTRLRFATDSVPDPVTRATAVFIQPRFRYAFLSRGQLHTDLEWGKVSTEPGNRSLPYELLEGDQTGNTFRWNLLLTYRLSAHMMGTLSYRGRKEPWLSHFYQTGQIEIRAFF